MKQVEHSEHFDAGYAEPRKGRTDQIPIREESAIQPALLLGYVSTDDLGSDGDDTPHIPYPTFDPPNVIGATVALPTSTPTLIDVIYNEFMEKVVLDGLKGLGSSYSSTDTRLALGGRV
jgi:hypothetical protein